MRMTPPQLKRAIYARDTRIWSVVTKFGYGKRCTLNTALLNKVIDTDTAP